MRRAHALLAAAAVALLSAPLLAQTAAPNYPGIGRSATAQEVAAWDIDVRPDFKGLPPGRGSVADGANLWEAKCASCHGVFGESLEFFSPLVGGTTAKDIEAGRTASLRDNSYPGRSTLMKLASVSTLWDYIRRAMPWTQPKSLSPDEVYALTAYLLNLADVVDANFVLSHTNMAQVQARLPNRNGMRTDHALWPGKALDAKAPRTPDVRAQTCMRDCGPVLKVSSNIPAYARNDHGNLALQNRLVGAQVGVETAAAAAAAKPTAAAAFSVPGAVQALLNQHNCLACHGVGNKVVGPGLLEVAQKYAKTPDAVAHLASRISGGSSGVWGAIAMPAQNLPGSDALSIAQWLAGATAKP